MAGSGGGFSWATLRALFKSRLLVSIYIGQYFITALTYFYATWFPLYLIRQRGMSVLDAGFSAVLPAAAGWVGGILGGIWTDALLRRGASLSYARKLPIAVGSIVSTIIVGCNFTSSGFLVILFMAIAFFGKGVASLGWVVIADAAPKEAAGLTGGIFNATSNIAGIITPIGIGYLVAATGSFDIALVAVAVHALLAAFFFCATSGPIRRLTLDRHAPNA
jgi:ACS family glucarate transporter-like MFS transporter